MKTWLKKTLSLVLTFTFLLDPALFPKKAYAWKDYDNSVCKQIDADKESGDPQRSPPQDALNECVNAKLARKVETAAKIKTVIFGAGAIACFAMAIWSFLGSDSICAAIGIALAATDMIMSQVFQHDAESTVGKVTSFVSMGQGMGIAAAGKLASGIFKKGAIKVGTKSSAKAGCIISGIVLTLMTAMAIWDWIESKNLGSKHLQNAKEMKDAYDARNRVNTNYGGTTGNTGNPGAAPGSSGTTDGGSSGDPCEGKTGNDYLKCLGQEAHDPQLSAMADNPDLDNLLTPLLGQHPAEFAKGYSGEPSLDGVRDYAAKALGISDGAKGILEKIQKAVMEDLGDKFTGGSGYKSAPAPVADIKKDDAPDFNKIMGDLLKQMNPEAKDMKETKENPTEAVYRRLDLLPAHQIESNKDLSLFIRVGYRYRKKSTVFDEAVKPPLPGKSSGSTAP